MTITFKQLGIPFPLFEAPVENASEYCGQRACSLCRVAAAHCFSLGIGAYVIATCPSCDAVAGLSADDREAGDCSRCGAVVPFPAVPEADLAACYNCLRGRQAALTKDTVLGMVSWEQALEGVTHGVPGLSRSDFEMVPKEDGWVGARLPTATLFELLRTPTYASIQGDLWQFCCGAPMIFIGTWTRDDFARNATHQDGRALFENIVQGPIPGLWDDELHDTTGIYVFRCPDCRRRTAHWDIA
jgi:uncharacterized protein CbrC (UPF0167 family)